MPPGKGLTSQTSLPETSASEGRCSAAGALVAQYRQPGALLSAFNPDRQVEIATDLRRACLSDAPPLGIVGRAFGHGTATSWLAIQLWNLAEFSGCKTKLSERQVAELAGIIRAEYGYMRLSELMYFFYRFKVGDYGKFFGAVDPQAITCALREFARERAAMCDRLRTEAREEARRRDPEYQRFKQAYLREHNSRRFYTLNFRSPDFTYEDFKEIEWLFNLGYERSDHPYTNP